MYCSKVLNSEHLDLIHDVAFNFHGSQLATCSSDATVKVWNWDAAAKTWTCSASWKCHSGSVWKVNWAHPEFGKLLATCSFDRTASIWEEIPGEAAPQGLQTLQQQQQQQSSASASASASAETNDPNASKFHWVKKASLVDSRTSVTDVKFSPKHHGLQLATCSADGVVRIYECTDIMNLSQWSLAHEIACKLPLSCVSWNPSIKKTQPPMIAVGSDDMNPDRGGKVLIFEYTEEQRVWTKVNTLSSMVEPVHDIAFAPNVGRSYNVLGIASNDLRIVTLKQTSSETSGIDGEDAAEAREHITGTPEHTYEIRLAGQFNDHASTVWRICWNITGTVLASSADDGQVKLWKSNYLDNWKCVANLRGDGGHTKDGGTLSGAAQGIASAQGKPWSME